MLTIPPSYKARPLKEEELKGWLGWSLDYFSDATIQQSPHLDLTMPLEITQPWQRHAASKQGVSFFAWLIWSFMQVVKQHPSFLLRKVGDEWLLIENPPVLVPVAVGGQSRFSGMVLEDVAGTDWQPFAERYQKRLAEIRAGDLCRASWCEYNLGFFIGNLPAIPFTAMTLHSHASDAHGRVCLYFGKWGWQDDKLFIPMAVKMHHANTDPYVLNQLVCTWREQWLD